MAPKRATRSTPVTENPTTTTVTNAQLQAMIDQGVTAALAARDANRNGDDSHTSGMGARKTERVARECTYQDFMKYQPLYFKGTEGVIKFSTCTLLAGALTWWNSHVRIVGHDVAYAMTWIDLRKKMTDKYCPRNEMKKLEAELWNLKVKGTDVTGYNQRFQELALLCVRMFPEESDKEATEMATELMDKKISTFAERQAENKRKLDNNHQAHQQLPKIYVDLKRKPMEFQVGDKVMFKVSPWKGVVRFGKRGKLNRRYVRPFKVLEKVGSVAYKLELPEELIRDHNTFYVSNLKKCSADEPLAIPLDGLHFDDKL
ncbi:reverse transcriptase domain-containing protein [Tanacetum coccineum]